jgi:hypothetical protein
LETKNDPGETHNNIRERKKKKASPPPPRKSKVYRILGAGEVAIQRMSGVSEKKSIKK